MKLNNKTYDTLKYVALIALPALQVFWLTIGKIWNISYTVEIGATIGAVALLLGTLLGVSTRNYYDKNQTQMFNEDLLKDMLGYEEMLHEEGEIESEELNSVTLRSRTFRRTYSIRSMWTGSTDRRRRTLSYLLSM